MFTYSVILTSSEGVSTLRCESIAETLKIDESLDSAILVVPFSTRQETYPRLSTVDIEIGDGTNTNDTEWIVYSDTVDATIKGVTTLYTHTLGLIEPTKLLEKYPCGSLTFTQPLGGVRYTMKDVIDRIQALVPFVPYTEVATTRVFTLDSTLGTYLDKIDAPQFYLDKKNLREALIEVFKYVNAIPRLRGGVLYADFINDRQKLISISTVAGLNLLDYKTDVNAEYYATKVEGYLENVITNEDRTQSSIYANSITDVISFRGDGVIVGQGNFKLILSHKMAFLNSIKVIVQTDETAVTPSTPIWERTVDITKYVPEKKVYDSLDFNKVGGVNWEDFQEYCMYWTYASDIIDGGTETFAAIFTSTAFGNMMGAISADNSWEYHVNLEKLYREVTFLIDYVPYIQTMRVEQHREDIDVINVESTIQINPNERINSLYDVTNNLYGQIQRLGVDTWAFSKKHDSLARYVSGTKPEGMFAVGDYTSFGHFITSIENVYYNNYLISRYELSKNWNRYAQFIQIDKEFRPYEISLFKSDFTLKRDITMPFCYIEIDTTDRHESEFTALRTTFMNTFKDSTYNQMLSIATLQLNWLDGETITGDNFGVQVPLISAAEKNTLKFKMDFKDTKLAGNQITVATVSAVDYLKQVQVPYTQDDGTFEIAKIKLFHNLWNHLLSGAHDANNQAAHLYFARLFPYYFDYVNLVYFEYGVGHQTCFAYDIAAERIANNFYYNSATKAVYQYVVDTDVLVGYASATKSTEIYTLPYYRALKDTSEILGFEMQMPIMPYKTKVNTFIVGDCLSQENVLIKIRENAKTLYFYHNTVPYTKANSKNVGSSTKITGTNFIDYVSNSTIAIPSALRSAYNYIAVGDADGKLYLGINQKALSGTKTEISTIYFNFKRERSF